MKITKTARKLSRASDISLFPMLTRGKADTRRACTGVSVWPTVRRSNQGAGFYPVVVPLAIFSDEFLRAALTGHDGKPIQNPLRLWMELSRVTGYDLVNAVNRVLPKHPISHQTIYAWSTDKRRGGQSKEVLDCLRRLTGADLRAYWALPGKGKTK